MGAQITQELNNVVSVSFSKFVGVGYMGTIITLTYPYLFEMASR